MGNIITAQVEYDKSKKFNLKTALGLSGLNKDFDWQGRTLSGYTDGSTFYEPNQEVNEGGTFTADTLSCIYTLNKWNIPVALENGGTSKLSIHLTNSSNSPLKPLTSDYESDEDLDIYWGSNLTVNIEPQTGYNVVSVYWKGDSKGSVTSFTIPKNDLTALESSAEGKKITEKGLSVYFTDKGVLKYYLDTGYFND